MNPHRKATIRDIVISVAISVAIVGLAIAAAILPLGCTTVTPKAVNAAGASFDGNLPTSGILEDLPNGDRRITPHVKARYAALVAIYGKTYLPPLKPDEGVTPAPDGINYLIDREHFVDFLDMNQKLKSGIKP